MGRFDKLPGIDDENTTRRNVLVGGGYAFAGMVGIGAIAGGTDDDEESPEDDDGTTDSTEPDDTDDTTDEDEGTTDESDDEDTDDELDDEDEIPRSDADTLLSLYDTLGDDEPLFDPGTETFSGTGQSVTDEFSLGGVLTVFTFEHGGDSNFAVNLEGETDELLVNTIGPIQGATAVPTPSGNYLMDIEADGEWEMNVGQPLAPDEEIRTVPVSANGEGPDVVGPLELEETVTVSGEHEGESNFAVHIYAEDDSGEFDGELVFNEIGEFEGETRVDYPGIVWIDVEADGPWSLEIS